VAVKSASSGFFVTLRFLLPPGPTHEAHYGRPMTSAVRVIADDNRTDGSSDETGSEGRQRSTKLPNALGWKEGVADLNREECAGQKIVELERVIEWLRLQHGAPEESFYLAIVQRQFPLPRAFSRFNP